MTTIRIPSLPDGGGHGAARSVPAHPGSDRWAAAQAAGSMLNTRSGTNALNFPGETCAYFLNHRAKTAPCSAFAARSSGVLRPSALEFLLNCYRRRLRVEHDQPVRRPSGKCRLSPDFP
jgi:hypothetical protein